MGAAKFQAESKIDTKALQSQNQNYIQSKQQNLQTLPKKLKVEIQEPGTSNINVLELSIYDPMLTCGWLLSEVIRQHQQQARTKTPIVCLKTLSSNEILDCMLLMFERPIEPLMEEKEIKAVFAEKIHSKQMINHFQPIKVIGKGGFSKVVQVRKKDTGKIYAMKSKELYFVLDFCPGGEFFYHLHNLGRLTEEQSKFYFGEILIGLEHLHNNDIVYRDLKPENVLLDIDGHVKLTDFGLSKDNMQKNKRSNSYCGSPEYMSPEMLKGTGHSKSLDFYSLGVLLYEMLTGIPPFYNQSIEIMHKNIQEQEIQIPSFISKEAQNLIYQLLIKDPDQRLGNQRGIQEIKDHPWCTSINWKLLSMKKISPPFVPNLKQSNFDHEYLNMPLDLNFDQQSENEFFSNPCFFGFEYQDEIEQKFSLFLDEKTPRNKINKDQIGISSFNNVLSILDNKNQAKKTKHKKQNTIEEQTTIAMSIKQSFIDDNLSSNQGTFSHLILPDPSNNSCAQKEE